MHPIPPLPKAKVFPTRSASFPATPISAQCAIPKRVLRSLPLRNPHSVINAGDGGHQHPTQTYADLLTIRSLKGHLNNLTIGLCGDLKFGRTVHSLVNALSRYDNLRFIFISPAELRVPDYITEMLREKNIPYEEVIRLEDKLPELDVLYMTRVQKERFFNEEDYVRLKDFYILTAKKMKLAPPDMLVLHPLPELTKSLSMWMTTREPFISNRCSTRSMFGWR